MRIGDSTGRASPATTVSIGTPTASAAAAAARALSTRCTPRAPSVTAARTGGSIAPAATRTKLGTSSSSSTTDSARTSPPGPKVITRAEVRAAIAITNGFAAFSTATPPSAAAGNDSTSSPFPSATASTDPNSLVCAAPTTVTIPTVGRPTAHNEAMWPIPRAPISSTSASVPSGALSTVSGTPISLLNDRWLAWVGRSAARTAASRSFVVVFPTEPVMPTTVPPSSRSRPADPSADSARAVSSTSITTIVSVRPTRSSTGRDDRAAAAPDAPMKSWPSRSATNGTNNAGTRSGSSGPPISRLSWVTISTTVAGSPRTIAPPTTSAISATVQRMWAV